MENKIERTATVKDIAEVLGVIEPWVRKLAVEGKIPGTKKGHKWFFNKEEVTAARFVDNKYKGN